MKRPNFFVAGAPRCGTTALYTYLKRHPYIFLPSIKELHYFASDFSDVQKIAFKTDNDYLKIFAGANERHLAVGEISPLYFYSKVALNRIKEFDPSAKIILALRNPVDFVQSIHQLNLGLLREDEPDLAKAWGLQDLRRQGKMLPASCREPRLVLYGELGLFGKYVERALEVFDRKQVLFLLFDDLASNPKAVYETLLSFLGVPSDGRTDFPAVNAGFEQKSKMLAKIIHPPRPVYRVFMKAISIFGVNFMKNISLIYNKIEGLNLQRTPRDAMDPSLRARLQSYFRDDIQKLAILTERDLSAWLTAA
ncbi:MAG: sulfotransferase domain-containing protein [Anaerolineales bacterium]|nr:sulfotransferase domain-containing protein [Anaerolineales bacterium]